MSETMHANAEAANSQATVESHSDGFDTAAGFAGAGAAAFADAETREILNLLGDQDAGSCCGGSCCSV